jgi:hypothetical protein
MPPVDTAGAVVTSGIEPNPRLAGAVQQQRQDVAGAHVRTVAQIRPEIHARASHLAGTCGPKSTPGAWSARGQELVDLGLASRRRRMRCFSGGPVGGSG